MFRPLDEWTISTIKHRPGLYILNGILSKSYQLKLLQKCLRVYPEPPNITNLTAHGLPAADGTNVFGTMPTKLRWVTIGNDYDWTEKRYAERPRTALPQEIHRMAQQVVGVLGLGEIHPDAIIINYYPEKATLSPHVDRSERDITRPLVSVSLGQSAVYLTGGPALSDPVDSLLLRSGDVLVMHAAQRLVYHAVPRVVKTCSFTCKDLNDTDVIEYANNYRVNITIRQVD